VLFNRRPPHRNASCSTARRTTLESA